MKQMVIGDLYAVTIDKVFIPGNLEQIVSRHKSMQHDHDKRQETVLPMLAWGPLQGYQAHLDREWLLKWIAAI